MPTNTDAELYTNHQGTVLVSGKSEVGKVARYIVHLIQMKVTPIDVFFIGANAGQQAYKACAVSSIIVRNELGVEIAFATVRAKTQTEKRDITGKVVLDNGNIEHIIKDAFIWRVVPVKGVAACSP